MLVERSKRAVEVEALSTIARQLLDASTLCAIATVTQGRSREHRLFAWVGNDFDLVWLSVPDSAHSQNLAHNPTAAVAVYDSGQTWNEPDRGIQLFGGAREGTGRDVPHGPRSSTVSARGYRRFDLEFAVSLQVTVLHRLMRRG